VNKIPSSEITGNSYLNKASSEVRKSNSFSVTMIKQIASYLSNIELGLDCYNLGHLKSSAILLKDLLNRMGLPTCCIYLDEILDFAQIGEYHQAGKSMTILKKETAGSLYGFINSTDL